METVIRPIAHIRTDFPTKFGVPRQSGLADTEAMIVFEPEFRNSDALRGLEDFSHIWLIWQFSENPEATDFCPTVRPPRLGGNKRMGVFATRSPFRPNRLGLSSVLLKGIYEHPTLGTVLYVVGADLVDNTPIFDIKPYIAFSDSHPEAIGGFSDAVRNNSLSVDFPERLAETLPEDKKEQLMCILKGDPRPSYHDDPERLYGFEFAGFEIKFKVNKDLLTVVYIKKL